MAEGFVLKNARIWFKKKDAAKYISHLDLSRCMGRVLRICRIPVWYTEGFNPRVYMTFAMPLSLGISGERECMDIRLTEEFPFQEIQSRMNGHLPLGMQVLGVSEPICKFDQIQWAQYHYEWKAEDGSLLLHQLQELFSREAVIVSKHTKKGKKDFDIKPYFSPGSFDLQSSGLLAGEVTLPCSVSGSVNPGLLQDALKSCCGMEVLADVCRQKLLTKDFAEIR